MPMTSEQIRTKGLEALRRELGRAGMIRFLNQFENGNGNYAQERHEWVDQMSLDELRKKTLGTKSKRKTKK